MAINLEVDSIGSMPMLVDAFNGVAALVGTNDFRSLAALGMLCGLLILVAKSFLRQSFEPQHLLVGFVLWSIMFVPKVTVTVVDTFTGESQQIAHVPIGVATPLAITSSVGQYFAKTYEQYFGYHGVYGSTSKGFMDPLFVLLNMRSLKLQDVVKGGASVSGDMNFSMTHYVVDCVRRDIDLASNGGSPEIKLSDVRSAADAWSKLKVSLAEVYTLVQLPGDDSPRQVSCQDAYAQLSAQLDSGSDASWYSSSLVPYLAKVLGKANNEADSVAIDRIEAAQAAISMSATSARNMAVNNFIGYLLDFNPVSGDITPEAAAAAAIKAQAIDQRNIAWSAERSMFESVSRMVAAFGEIFCVAASPILGFMIVVMGVAGLQALGKFLMLHVWVTLWAPVLSISDMYIYHAINDWTAIAQSQDGMSLLSISGFNSLAQELQRWVATGSMLAATTPMLTLFLISGSWIAANSIASRVQGSGSVDSSIASPPLLQQAPVAHALPTMNVQPGVSSDMNGALLPQLNMTGGHGSTTGSSTTTSLATGARTELARAGTTSSNLSVAGSSTLTNSTTSSESTAFTSQAQSAYDKALQFLDSHGIQVSNKDALGASFRSTLAKQLGIGLGNVGDALSTEGRVAGGPAASPAAGVPAQAATGGAPIGKAVGALLNLIKANVSRNSDASTSATHGAESSNSTGFTEQEAEGLRQVLTEGVQRVSQLQAQTSASRSESATRSDVLSGSTTGTEATSLTRGRTEGDARETRGVDAASFGLGLTPGQVFKMLSSGPGGIKSGLQSLSDFVLKQASLQGKGDAVQQAMSAASRLDHSPSGLNLSTGGMAIGADGRVPSRKEVAEFNKLYAALPVITPGLPSGAYEDFFGRNLRGPIHENRSPEQHDPGVQEKPLKKQVDDLATARPPNEPAYINQSAKQLEGRVRQEKNKQDRERRQLPEQAEAQIAQFREAKRAAMEDEKPGKFGNVAARGMSMMDALMRSGPEVQDRLADEARAVWRGFTPETQRDILGNMYDKNPLAHAVSREQFINSNMEVLNSNPIESWNADMLKKLAGR